MLSYEDKKDVSRAFGKGVANKVSSATKDSKSRALKKVDKGIIAKDKESKKTGWYGAKGFDEHFVPKRYR